MVMTLGTGTISNYSSYINNCRRNQLNYKIPVNSLSDVQLYISIGETIPDAVQYQIIHTCGGGTIETLATPDYVVGQDTNNNWYGVFRNFSGTTPSCFVIAITLTTGDDDVIYFSEEYCKENTCNDLTLIKGCYGNLDNKISYDCEDVYFGTALGPAVGDTSIVYKHELLIRGAEVYLTAIKNTFKQGRTRTFRTEKEKIFQFNAERIPEWYLSEIDSVFYRGEVYIGDTRYLLNETAYELIDDCKKQWLPRATFKESCYQSFSCEADPCTPPVTVCCDPEVISFDVSEVVIESGFPVESGFPDESGTDDDDVNSTIITIEALVDGTPNVTGTADTVTGLTNGSTVVTCDSFVLNRVYVERGGIQIFGYDRGDGTTYYTKSLIDNFITFSDALATGEPIYIQTIP